MGEFVAVAARPREMLAGYSGLVRTAFARRLPLWAIVVLDAAALLIALGAFKVVTGMVLDARPFTESEVAVVKDRDLWPFLTPAPAPAAAETSVAALPVPDGAILFAPEHPGVQRLALFIDAPSPDGFEVAFDPPPIYTGGAGSGNGDDVTSAPAPDRPADPAAPDDPPAPPGPAEPAEPLSAGPVTRAVVTVVDAATETVGAAVNAVPLGSSNTASSAVAATTDTVGSAAQSIGDAATGTVGGLLR